MVSESASAADSGSASGSVSASVPASVTTPAGTGTSSLAFTVLTTDPVISSFSSTFSFIEPGQSVTLSWSAVNAATLVMQENGDPGTAITASGSKLVTPAVSTTYLITATGNGKTVYRHVTVTVRGKMSWKRDIIYLGGKEVGEVDGTGGRSVLTDHLGTPRILVKPDGTVIEQKFAPFGESLTEPAAMNSFAKGFTNHEQTDASGLIYMQARFYAPMYHRFLSPDPKRDEHFENTQAWNIYAYCENNPVTRIDPDGMDWIDDALKGAHTALTTMNPGYQLVAMVRDVVVAGANAGLGTDVSMNSNLGQAAERGAGPVEMAGHALEVPMAIVSGEVGGALIGKGLQGASRLVGRGAAESAVTVSEKVVEKSLDPKTLLSRQGSSEMSGSKVNRLAKDMKANGFDKSKPIDVANADGKNVIVDGHHRVKGAIKAGIKQVPVRVQSTTREQATQLLKEVAETRKD